MGAAYIVIFLVHGWMRCVGLVDAMLVWSMLWLLNFVQLEYFCHGRACVVQEVLIVWGETSCSLWRRRLQFRGRGFLHTHTLALCKAHFFPQQMAGRLPVLSTVTLTGL